MLSWKFLDDFTIGFVTTLETRRRRAMVLVSTKRSVLVALEASSGKELWRSRLPYCLDSVYCPIARPAPSVDGDTIYVGGMLALNAKTGRAIWRKPRIETIGMQPTVLQDSVFCGSYNATVFAFAARRGTLRWKTILQGGATSPIAASPLGRIMMGTSPSNSRFGPKENPAMRDGIFYCLNASSGAIVWQFKPSHNVAFMTEPTVVDIDAQEVVLVTAIAPDQFTLYALGGDTGRILWKYNTPSRVDSKAFVKHIPGHGWVVFLGCTNGVIYAVQFSTSRLVWSFQMPSSVVGGIALIDGNRLIASCVNGVISSFCDHTGDVIWSSPRLGSVTSSISASEPIKMLLIPSHDGNVYAYNYTTMTDCDYETFIAPSKVRTAVPTYRASRRPTLIPTIFKTMTTLAPTATNAASPTVAPTGSFTIAPPSTQPVAPPMTIATNSTHNSTYLLPTFHPTIFGSGDGEGSGGGKNITNVTLPSSPIQRKEHHLAPSEIIVAALFCCSLVVICIYMLYKYQQITNKKGTLRKDCLKSKAPFYSASRITEIIKRAGAAMWIFFSGQQADHQDHQIYETTNLYNSEFNE